MIDKGIYSLFCNCFLLIGVFLRDLKINLLQLTHGNINLHIIKTRTTCAYNINPENNCTYRSFL